MFATGRSVVLKPICKRVLRNGLSTIFRRGSIQELHLMRTRVHPSAIVGKGVSLGEGCQVAAHSVLKGMVKVGKGCFIAENVTIQGKVTLGRACYVGQNSVIGFPNRPGWS